MKLVYVFLLLAGSIYGADSLLSWLQEGKISGNVRYVYIETDKRVFLGKYTGQYGNSVGGQLKYTTALWNGWKIATAFMTTHPFLLPENAESSGIGQDNGFMGEDPRKGYSLVGEAFVDYQNNLYHVWAGRRLITSPMIGEKDVRMLPSTVQGGDIKLALNDTTTLSAGYIDHFKQRSSDDFTNIVKHALGTDMYAITGHEEGYVVPLQLSYKTQPLTINFYDLYSPDFLNTAYADIEYKHDFYTLMAQWVLQNSIGNADINLAKADSVTKGKRINATGFGARAILRYNESSFDFTYRTILRDASAYDSIITPWDGTLLYAYSNASNNLGQSFYGNALTSGGAYVGGTQGYKIGYTQKYDFTGLKGFSTNIAYAIYRNPIFRGNQNDLIALLKYKKGDFSLEFKGVWIDEDTTTAKDGSVKQVDWLTQYQVTANYAF